MSFLEHLEELRRRLIVCVVAIIICMAVSCLLVPTVQQFITRPLQEPSVTQKWSYVLESWVTQKFPDLAHRLGLKPEPVSYTHLRAHETRHDLVCRLLL